MKYFSLITFVFFSITLTAQNYDFGKVSKEELQEKFNPLDSSASATYLYKYRKSYFIYSQDKGFQLVTEIRERVKIYNQEGFDYATKEVYLSKSGGEKEKLTGLKAYAYNLIDGKIEEDKLKNDGVFNTELNKYLDQTKFTMPNIKEGSIIEYEYRIDSPFYWNVDEFKFQYAIPIKKLEAAFEAPEYFSFKINTKGFLSVIPKMDAKSDKITFKSKTRTFNSGTEFNSDDLEFIKNVSSYRLENIPALKNEPYVNNINNYRSSVKYELSYTKFPNSIIKYYSTTWEDVIKTIYDSPNFGGELDKMGYYEEAVDALIGSVLDPMQRAALIFNFVKSKVKWNGYYSYYTNDGVRKAYKDQVGNVAEINLMLTSMLRHAGLNSNPVLVSTRDNGVPLFPTREGYNYVISCIEISNAVILLDATSKYSTPNVLPYRTLNWEGRIIRKDGSTSTVNLYPNEKSKNTVSMQVNLNDGGNIEGSIRTVKTSHNAMSYRVDYMETDKDKFLEELENKYSGMEIDEFEVKNDSDLSKPIMESYKFSLESQADIIGNKIYFSPLFFFKTKENPFKLEKREFPIDFGYPYNNKYIVNIKLPEGYLVESAPDPKVLVLPDNLGSFKYNINIVANQTSVQLVIDTELNEAIISPLYYEVLKEYFKQLIEKENEQIVLTKA